MILPDSLGATLMGKQQVSRSQLRRLISNVDGSGLQAAFLLTSASKSTWLWDLAVKCGRNMRSHIQWVVQSLSLHLSFCIISPNFPGSGYGWAL